MIVQTIPHGLSEHRVKAVSPTDVANGIVRWAPAKSIWFSAMTLIAIVGGVHFFSWSALILFVFSTGFVLLFGHSLGSHRKLIHNSYQCPKSLERFLVYCGVLVGLAGPLGLLRQHELRDFAQRLPDCHPYLRHGRTFLMDGWWQLHCELLLTNPPAVRIDPLITEDPFYRLLEKTWMLQQLPIAVLFYACGGWAFVVYGVCARVSAGVLGHWLIGYFAHNHGEMQYKVHGAAVQGRNVHWTSLLTMGESWHNNHHAFPGSARLGLKAGEWDPGWWVLMALSKMRLVWAIRLPADLPPRPELSLVAAAGDSSFRLRAILSMIIHPDRLPSPEVMWPGRWLTSRWMCRLLDPSITITPKHSAVRLTLGLNGRDSIRGLPALCVALAHNRRTAVRFFIASLLPLAVAIEMGRSAHKPHVI